jgi:hypothetical protein
MSKLTEEQRALSLLFKMEVENSGAIISTIFHNLTKASVYEEARDQLLKESLIDQHNHLEKGKE